MSPNDHVSRQTAAENLALLRRSTTVSDELGRIMQIMREAFPAETTVTFEFDGALRVHIDVRALEDVTHIETVLPSMCGGIFSDPQRRLSAKHSFFHRLSANVAL